LSQGEQTDFSPIRVRRSFGAIVGAAPSPSHSYKSTASAVRSIADSIGLGSIVKRGDSVLLKVNMGCTGFRIPEGRYTSHPSYVAGIIECLKDCGARVMFGDDVSRAKRHVEKLWASTGMSDVAHRTGAQLVDPVAFGGREVRGRLRYPRTHFVTNLLFDVDAVVNAANCRSLSDVVFSGAIKNMFGMVLGTRKARLHGMFPDIRDFSRVIVDVCHIARPAVSFLDLTSVIEGQGLADAIREVGLMLGSADPVAVDTVAAHAIGYEQLTVWTTVYGSAAGLGCNEMDRIDIRGLDWPDFPKKALRYPAPPRTGRGSLYDRLTRSLNHTILRPRPVIVQDRCTGCGDCSDRCPASAIAPLGRTFQVSQRACADCGCCIRVCEHEAVRLEFTRVASSVRRVKAALWWQATQGARSGAGHQ